MSSLSTSNRPDRSSSGLALSRVLLVDDSAEDNFIHRRQLRRHWRNCEVAVATNGQEALDLLMARADAGEEPFELMCLDVNMPVMDAWEFLGQYPHLPLEAHVDHIALMISTALPAEARSIADKSPFISFFVSKPFTGERISAQIENANAKA